MFTLTGKEPWCIHPRLAAMRWLALICIICKNGFEEVAWTRHFNSINKIRWSWQLQSLNPGREKIFSFPSVCLMCGNYVQTCNIFPQKAGKSYARFDSGLNGPLTDLTKTNKKQVIFCFGQIHRTSSSMEKIDGVNLKFLTVIHLTVIKVFILIWKL